MKKLLPDWNDIPQEFKDGNTKWTQLFNQLFFHGNASGTITSVEGIDIMKAGRHLRAIKSYEPKHQHKEAGVAYLMSLWFGDWEPEGTSLNNRSEKEGETAQ